MQLFNYRLALVIGLCITGILNGILPALGANVNPLDLSLTTTVPAPQATGAGITIIGAITRHASGQIPYNYLFEYSLASLQLRQTIPLTRQ